MADFGQLSKEIESWQERAAWLVLKHPYTGEPIGGDEAARILLTSPLSKAMAGDGPHLAGRAHCEPPA